MKHRVLKIILALSLTLAFVSSAVAGTPGPRPLPQASGGYLPGIAGLKLDAPATTTDAPAALKLNAALAKASGPQEVIVRLSQLPTAQLFANGARPGAAAVRGQLRTVKSQQNAILKVARTLDPNVKILGSVQRALNAVMLKIDAAALNTLAANANVTAINPIHNYQLDLSETVPWIGATALHNDLGLKGQGVRVAVLDSGTDYTHVAFGGSGSVDEYNANDPNIIEDGSFPTAKVIGGYDFVGSNWPNTDLEPDPDPLDKGAGAGHGTHVASIIAGMAKAGTQVYDGVAPEASLYSLKVCSSVSTSCSGVAMIQGIDWAMDPNGDGDFSDHADLINMSIGSPYGQGWDDDTSAAVDNATIVGILSVASAGNNSDKPYIVGTPSAAISALSVAQTEVPSAFYQYIQLTPTSGSPFKVAGLWLSWSAPLTAIIDAPVMYPTASTAKKLGCNADGSSPYAAGELAGKIVLVDRGSCSVSLKNTNVAAAGGLATIVALVAAGDPYPFAYGGGAQPTPAYSITLADGNKIKANLAGLTAKLDPADVLSLGKHVTSTSSRGPAGWSVPWIPTRTNLVKPEIGAPGASVSAILGTGDGVGPFGGTSGAAPMVTGSAALLLSDGSDKAGLSPLELKAVLVNNAETDVMNKPAVFGGYLAPISRIGGGEVRVDQSYYAPALVYEQIVPATSVTPPLLLPILSFGFWDVSKEMKVGSIGRWLTVKNLTNEDLTYKVNYTFRYQNDIDTGAVLLSFGEMSVAQDTTITVPANGEVKLKVNLAIDSTKLRWWNFNSGSQGANPDVLTSLEYDGYIWFDNQATTEDDCSTCMLHMPWHVLPRKAGDLQAVAFDHNPLKYNLMNTGANPVFVDSYSLLGTSDMMPVGRWETKGAQAPVTDLKGFGVSTFAVPTDYCDSELLFQFAVNTWDRTIHANVPTEFDVYLDIDQDGAADYIVYNDEYGWVSGAGFAADGRNAVVAYNVATGKGTIWWLTDHSTNSANTVLTVCGEQIGLSMADIGKVVNVDLAAFDVYFSGNLMDSIEGMQMATGLDRYIATIDYLGGGIVMPNLADPGLEMTVTDFGDAGGSDMGVMLINTAPRSTTSGATVYSGAPIGNDATLLPIP